MSTELVRGLREVADFLMEHPDSPLADASGVQAPRFNLHLDPGEWAPAVDGLGTYDLTNESPEYIVATRTLAGDVTIGYQSLVADTADVLLTYPTCEGSGSLTECPSGDPREAVNHDCSDCDGQGRLTTAALAELHAARRPPEPHFDTEDTPF